MKSRICYNIVVYASICANNTANQHNVFQSCFDTMIVQHQQTSYDDSCHVFSRKSAMIMDIYVCERHVLANDCSWTCDEGTPVMYGHFLWDIKLPLGDRFHCIWLGINPWIAENELQYMIAISHCAGTTIPNMPISHMRLRGAHHVARIYNRPPEANSSCLL